MILPLIYGVLLFLNHYISERILRKYQHKTKLISFSAGVAVTYIILELLPTLSIAAEEIHENLFVIVLLGILSFHIMEKYFYKHSIKNKLRKQLKELHSIGFFVYHFIVGIILAESVNRDLTEGTLFFIILLFHNAVSGTSLSEIHAMVTEKGFVKTILASSTFLGVLLNVLYPIPSKIYFVLLAYLVGIILYTVFRESIPSGKEGSPTYFTAGVLIFTILILLTRSFF